ncbi:iron-containing alcohol dehydrogenase [Halanaerobacter jeridensis]|uniref:Glycerol dehydrogenase-like iron-containing ADH family enzyme n=1 Tax=Halanaerobacter jeridensis TaxID=706427 RepID=A0A938XR84_9FIRM|nr:iron-containing alcohol dehydrogenase [Halanaerobacter jeridensis]MBM7555903.1 glycerol dehydrogenase-like iron-containing ADH family enzyme [Halanaerobacter jeridensis]
MVLTDKSPQLIEEVIEFCQELGLPTTLADLGIIEINESEIMDVAEASCAEGETIYNLPFEVTPKMVKDAILAADRLGR